MVIVKYQYIARISVLTCLNKHSFYSIFISVVRKKFFGNGKSIRSLNFFLPKCNYSVNLSLRFSFQFSLYLDLFSRGFSLERGPDQNPYCQAAGTPDHTAPLTFRLWYFDKLKQNNRRIVEYYSVSAGFVERGPDQNPYCQYAVA